MRIPGQHNRTTDLHSEAMTPMIDVVFLLLVFFVCASVGQVPDVLLPAELNAGVAETAVDLPQPEESEHQEVRISLLPGVPPGSVAIELNERPVPTSADLRLRLIRLSEVDAQSHIILVIDDAVSVQQGIAIYDLCQALAFEDISFGVRE